MLSLFSLIIIIIQNVWFARHRQEAPKTIDQIHREAKQEQREEWEMMKLSEDRRES